VGAVTFQHILAARKIVARFLKQTPLIHYPELSDRLGFQAYVKHENHHPTGSFKVRGGLNFMHHLPQVQREKGVITGITVSLLLTPQRGLGSRQRLLYRMGTTQRRTVRCAPSVLN